MNTVAYVKEVKGKYAIVEAQRKSACDGCHKNENGEGCAMCKIFGGDATLRAKAINSVGASVGDKVEIESSSARMLSYALIVFILPLLCCIAVYFIAASMIGGEAYPAALAVAAFIVSFGIVAVVSRLWISKRCDIEIVKIID